MAKYLIKASHTAEGAKGLLEEGGTARRTAVEQALNSMGGKLDAFYYAFGETDLFCIVDLPDNAAATAASLVVNASGKASVQYTVLITPEEVDEATGEYQDEQDVLGDYLNERCFFTAEAITASETGMRRTTR